MYFVLAIALSHLPLVDETAPFQIPFCVTKSDITAPIKLSLLELLRDAFQIDTFVETGTFLGGTTQQAAQVFQKVHSIELSPELCQLAKARFQNPNQVEIHEGDSPIILGQILPQIQSKILFYLDGHYSGAGTGKGPKNTPILDELEAIATSGKSDSAILIDDIRIFQSSLHPDRVAAHHQENYPELPLLCSALLQINPLYQICFLGDALFAYPPSSRVAITPLLRACTLHHLAFSVSEKDLEEADQIVMEAFGEERAQLLAYSQIYASTELEMGYRSYATFWIGLSLLGLGLEEQALSLFKQAADNSLRDWRIQKYIK